MFVNNGKNKFNKTWVIIWIIAFVFVLPFIALFVQLIFPEIEIWNHLIDTVLGSYLNSSLMLMLFVGILAIILGLSSAWFIAIYDFPGRKILSWLLILPMAMPAYIVAYSYTWFLDVSGPVQQIIRDYYGLGFNEYYFPNIRSFAGACIVLSFVLYPYIYILCRSAFSHLPKSLLEVNNSLGKNHSVYFYRIALPLARPALFGGLALVLMETLADYGTVEYFGVQTLTTGILKTWSGLGSLTGAAQIAAMILFIVIIVMMIEKLSRSQARFHVVNSTQNQSARLVLSGFKKWSVTLYCLFIVFVGFFIPIILLVFMLLKSNIQTEFFVYVELIWNTVSLASIVAILTVAIAAFMITIKRYSQASHIKVLVNIMSVGYAIPGLVIAVGVVISFGWLDHAINSVMNYFGYGSVGLILSGGFIVLTTAYIIRFMAVAIQPINSAYQGINNHIDEASFLSGKNKWQTFKAIHLPLIKGSILTALLLVFVDLLKELPATLVLRPFNFNTLAVKTYELASDERLADSAFPALCIVMVSLLPVIFINKKFSNKS
ncbi:MAG: ABC transporter permease [Marinicellaceae bacterium]